MPALPPEVIRSIEGSAEGGGRTLTLAGPPGSGKSDLLTLIRAEVEHRGFRRVQLHGTYRDRATPYAALENLEAAAMEGGDAGSERLSADASGMYGFSPVVIPFPVGDLGGRGRRGRGDRTGYGSGLGGSSHRRGGRTIDGPAVYSEILHLLQLEPHRPVALLIEDGTLFDPESRDAILYLFERVHYRPILVVVVLDVSLPAYASWEERLHGRGDVDWIRIPHPLVDAREADRLQETFATLPEETQRALVYTALLGGSVGEVSLGRATRMGFGELADALAPALAVNLVRVGEGRVMIPHATWVELIPGFVPVSVRQEIHREIADALSALHPEPDLKRGIELADHLFEASPDRVALRHLLESAEISERLYAFDTAAGLLAKAQLCLSELSGPERAEVESELRVLQSRALLFSGRVVEAEPEVRDGVRLALRENVDPERLEEWVGSLLPALRAVGPRPALAGVLAELVVECSNAQARKIEVLLQSILAEYELEQGSYANALVRAARAADLAQDLDAGMAQSMAMFVDAIGSATRDSSQETRTPHFHDPATSALGRVGRHVLEQIVEELQLRLVERRYHPELALQSHQRAVPVLRRMRELGTELYHQLDIGEILLDGSGGSKAREPVARAREITGTLHLVPPSPVLERTWILQGRLAAFEGRLDTAKDLWSAIVDRPGPVLLPIYRAEAIVRLALLELSQERRGVAETWLDRLAEPALAAKVPSWWMSALTDLAPVAASSRAGSRALPSR